MDNQFIAMHSLTQIIDRMHHRQIKKEDIISILRRLKGVRKVLIKEISDLILHISDTSHRGWDFDIILNSINTVFDGINWRGVYEKFLESDLKIWNKEYLYSLVDCWVHVSGIITVPYEIFFRKWLNYENQIEFFKILFESDEKRTQIYSNIFFERLVTKEELRTTRHRKTIEFESNFNGLEIFQSLQDLDAREVIEFIGSKSVEYCLLGLARVAPFCVDYFDELFVSFCETHASNIIYAILFERSRVFVLEAFGRLRTRLSLPRILDIFAEHKMLPVVSAELEPRELCFDLVVLSARRDYVNLDVWLNGLTITRAIEFVDYFWHKMTGADASTLITKYFTTSKDTDNTIESNNIVSNSSITSSTFPQLRSDIKTFPFNRIIAAIVTRVLKTKELGEEADERLRIIRVLVDGKIDNNDESATCATRFVAKLISSQTGLEECLTKLSEMVRGDEGAQAFAKGVFNLLIDNYDNLYRLPNSDMIATFFGELVKRRVFPRPFAKAALVLVCNSGRNPATEREHAFAFRIMEIFLPGNAEFLREVESIESIRNALIKKGLILIDEDSQAFIEFDGLLRLILGIDITGVKDNCVEGCRSGCKNECSNNHEMAYSDVMRDILGQDSKQLKRVFANCICKVLFFLRSTQGSNEDKLLDNNDSNFDDNSSIVDIAVDMVTKECSTFKDLFVETAFDLLKATFVYKFSDEVTYFRRLGSLIGRLVLSQNKAISLEVFDARRHILKSIEHRRISVCVHFVVALLREGTRGILWVPKNPWLMGILDVLAELYGCTLSEIRDLIRGLFDYLGAEMEQRPPVRIKEHFIKYTIEYEGVLRQVVACALEFSVREICGRIVAAALAAARVTAVRIFLRLQGAEVLRTLGQRVTGIFCYTPFTSDEVKRFCLFRNLFANLARPLVHILAHEPLKASICGNLSNFLKLSQNELAIEDIYEIAADNILACCYFIEKVVITRVNEIALDVYNNGVKIVDNNNNNNKSNNLTVNNNNITGNSTINDIFNESTFNINFQGRSAADRLNTTDSNNTVISSVNNSNSLIINNLNNSSHNIPDNNPNTLYNVINDTFNKLYISPRSDNYSYNISLLTESNFVQKTYVKAIDNIEYQEIRAFLTQIGHKMPYRKKDFISEEWPLLLGNSGDDAFQRVLARIETGHNRDAQFFCICKYLVGHLLTNPDDPAFRFLLRILHTSERTKHEVTSWLLYSTDAKKNNVRFVKKFIIHGLVYLEEFDQALSRSVSLGPSHVAFAVSLLEDLILADVAYCSIYDFVRTIEALHIIVDNSRVFDFFKRIEAGMIRITDLSCNSFNDALASIDLTSSPASIRATFRTRYKLNFKVAFKAAWQHFLIHTGIYRYSKVDVLAILVKDSLFIALKEALIILVQAYSKHQHLFFTFFCRFFLSVLDHVDDTVETRTIVAKTLELLAPFVLPGFAAHFVTVLGHKYIAKFLARTESFAYFKDILQLLHYDLAYQSIVVPFFLANTSFSKKYNLYLSYLCPESVPVLKNLFNQSRSRAYIEKASNPFFAAFFNLSKYSKNDPYNYSYNILIDNLNESSTIAKTVIEKLRFLLQNNSYRNEIILLLLIRLNASQTPSTIPLACTDLFNLPEYKMIVEDFNNKYFK